MSADDDLTDDEMRNIRASPWAIKAGLLVEKDGQVFFTAKGLAAIRADLEKDGTIPRRN